MTDFVESCGKNDLVILDNAHAGFDSINNLLCDVYKHDALLLLTSRNVDSTVTQRQHPDDAQEVISYAEIFKEEDAFKELCANQKTIRHIINQYAGSIVQEEKIGNIDTLVDKCKADYNILRFYIQAWKSKGRTGCLSDVYEKEILEDVFTRYLKDKPYQLELLKIAALSQFEIDVDSKWIKGDLDELQKDGLVQLAGTDEVELGKYVSWLRIYHPSAAEYIVKAAAFKHLHKIKHAGEFALQSLKDYLSISPFNFFRVFYDLHIHNQEKNKHELIEKYCLKQLAVDVIQKQSIEYIETHFWFIVGYILVIAKMKTSNKIWAAEKLFKPLLKRISDIKYETIPLGTLNVTLLVIRELSVDIDVLVSHVNFKNLGKQAKNTKVSLFRVVTLIRRIQQAGVHREQVIEFCEGLSFKDLGKRAKNKKTGLATVKKFIQYVLQAGVHREQVIEFCEGLSFKDLGEQAKNNTVGLATVRNFIELARQAGVHREQVIEFCEGLSFKDLGEQAKNNTVGLATVRIFIELALQTGVSRKQIVEFCEGLSFKDLAHVCQLRS